MRNLDGRSVNYTNMGTGSANFTPRMWLGMALDHLNEPNQSLLSGESRLPGSSACMADIASTSVPR